MIKSNKYGITLILDKNIPFSELLVCIGEKFKENGNFFKDAKMAVSLEGRPLTNEEQMKIVDVITENSQIKIVSILDCDKEVEERMKERVETADMPSSAQEQENTISEEIPLTAYFHKGNLRSGQVLEWPSSVTLIGDVNPGATVISGGNIVILGSLKGNACAGASGDTNCFIFALDMNPIQLQIGELIAKSPDKDKKSKFSRKKNKKTNEPYTSQIAVVKDGFICIEPMEKGCLNRFN